MRANELRAAAFNALALLLLAVVAVAQPARQELFYSAEVKADDAKRIHFTLEVRNPTGEELVFELPFWAPGSYRPITVAAFGGPLAITSMEGFAAEDGNGKTLPVTRAEERRFTVAAGKASVVRFKYTNNNPGASANNRSYLRENAGLIDGPRSWAWLHGAKEQPIMVRFVLPPDWQAACGLERTVDPLVFHADDYDRLVDSPVAIGLMDRWVQLVRGVPHEIVALTAGKENATEVPALQDMVRRIVETTVDIFGDNPYAHYSFIYTPGGGGLEHLNSTTIGTANPARISVPGTRGVTAHEYFHTFNVKRMRPTLLGPFDYTQAAPVDDLWICEGLTSYYANIVLWRGGLITDSEFAATYRASITGYESNAAHLEQSPQASSRGVWANDTRISYYLQGEVLGLALDLAIREGSNNRFGLDQAMRRMYRDFGGYYRHGAALPGFASADFPRVIREVSGVNVDSFFANHIRGAREVDWNRYLGAAGISLVFSESERSAFATLRRTGGTELPAGEGTPLAKAGLRSGDKILAVDGKDTAEMRDALRALGSAAAGAKLSLKIERAGAAKELDIVVPTAGDISVLSLAEEEGVVRVAAVPQVEAFAKGTLHVGDVILAVNGHKSTDRALVQQWLHAVAPGSEVTLLVRREKTEHTIRLKASRHLQRRVTSFDFLPTATPRQLAIRDGLKTGSTTLAPAR